MRKAAPRRKFPEIWKLLSGLTAEQKDKVALELNTTVGQLKQVASGNRPCSVELSISLDKFTKGDLSLRKTRDDIDWDHVKKALARKEPASI